MPTFYYRNSCTMPRYSHRFWNESNNKEGECSACQRRRREITERTNSDDVFVAFVELSFEEQLTVMLSTRLLNFQPNKSCSNNACLSTLLLHNHGTRKIMSQPKYQNFPRSCLRHDAAVLTSRPRQQESRRIVHSPKICPVAVRRWRAGPPMYDMT